MTAPDRFNDGYKAAEHHYRNRLLDTQHDLERARQEIDRLRTTVWALQEQDERAEIWREKANQYHARLAAVEALADPDYPPPPPDERGAAGWRFAMDHVRAALETDTTKGNQ